MDEGEVKPADDAVPKAVFPKQKASMWRDSTFVTLFIGIISAFLLFLANIGATYLNNRNALEVERFKAQLS
jgi:hypothetical protein